MYRLPVKMLRWKAVAYVAFTCILVYGVLEEGWLLLKEEFRITPRE